MKQNTFEKEYDELRALIAKHMSWPLVKADAWMKTDNPLLGGVAPLTFIFVGRGHKVRKFIEAAIDESKPAEPKPDAEGEGKL